MSDTPMKAWHFVNDTLHDGSPVPQDGETLVFTGEPILCLQGYHASLSARDALRYAPGNILCLVECGGKIIEDTDKLVCTERTIIQRIDATEMLRYFARMQAVSVIHLYPNDTDDVVFDFLMTGKNAYAAYDAANATTYATYATNTAANATYAANAVTNAAAAANAYATATANATANATAYATAAYAATYAAAYAAQAAYATATANATANAAYAAHAAHRMPPGAAIYSPYAAANAAAANDFNQLVYENFGDEK